MLTRTRNIESEGMISHRGAVLIRARATYCSNQRPDIRTQLTLKMSGKAKAGRLQITRCTYMCAPARAQATKQVRFCRRQRSACGVPSSVPPEKGVYATATGFRTPESQSRLKPLLQEREREYRYLTTVRWGRRVGVGPSPGSLGVSGSSSWANIMPWPFSLE